MLATAEQQRPSVQAAAHVYLRPAASDDAPALSSLLQRVFQVPSTAMLLDERHLAWKYWGDRDDWSGPRSFTARHDGAIVAHVAAWPVRILVPGQQLRAAHLIDWASDPRYPGAGLWLLRNVRRQTRLLIATGGTDITRRTLPVLGFRPLGEICVVARPLRPFAQSRTSTPRNWRLAGRLVRNSAWRWTAPASPPAGWSAAPIDAADIDESIWPAPSETTAVAARGAAFYRYVFASPRARYALYGVRHCGRLAGYFCIASARHVARIADLWMASTRVEDWSAAVRCAVEIAGQSTDVHEVSAWTSTALGREAFARAGFRVRDRAALTALGDAAPLAGRELHIQMLDCDASFVAADEVCYLT